jgi:dihydrofolate synthase/folylpolyglutamate synthase
MNFFKILKEYENVVFGLSKIKDFLVSIDNPQDKVRSVHIAGSNGKGSTAVFVSEILKSAGYETALYTSPHLINIVERIRINGKNIPIKKFYELSEKYLKKAIKHKLSYFEYLTALAFIYFAEKKVDIAVIETGLGGRFDATNVIKKPLVCVITSIAKEHQEILGDTIKKIASEKAGIIKKGVAVVCGKLSTEAINVINNNSKNVYLYGKDFRVLNSKSYSFKQKFDYVGKSIKLKNIWINLLGEYQIINASVAMCVSEFLNNKGYFLNERHIRAGFKNTVWPGRFDIKKVYIKNKAFELIVDGAHNIQGVNEFIKTFKRLGFAQEKRVFVFAVMKEKEYEYMIKKIIPFVKKVILPSINNSRAVRPFILQMEFAKYISLDRIYLVNSVREVFDIINDGETVVSVGSLYLTGEILRVIKYKKDV